MNVNNGPSKTESHINGAEISNYRIGPNRPPPPPRPSQNLVISEELRSSDSDTKSKSAESPRSTSSSDQIKMVILGGGFAGASLAVAFQHDSRFDVTLVDCKDVFVYTPSVIHLLSQPSRLSSITVSYRNLIKRGKFIQSHIIELLDDRVKLECDEILFDYCFLCTGSYYMISGTTRKNEPEAPKSKSTPADKKNRSKKKNPLQYSSRMITAITPRQRLKAILSDPILKPLYNNFVATRPELNREYRSLLYLYDISSFKAAYLKLEKTTGPANSSTNSTPRPIRKYFKAILDHYVAPGSLSEIRFSTVVTNSPTSETRDPIKDHLLSVDIKTIDINVFQASKKVLLNVLCETSLEKFLDSIYADSVTAAATPRLFSGNLNPSQPEPSPASQSKPSPHRNTSSTPTALSIPSSARSSSSSSFSPSSLSQSSNNMRRSSKKNPAASEPSTSPVISSSTSSGLTMEVHETTTFYSPSCIDSPPSTSKPIPIVNPISSGGIGNLSQSPSTNLNAKYPSLIPPIKSIRCQILCSQYWPEHLFRIPAAQTIAIVGGDLLAIELIAEIHATYPDKPITLIHNHRNFLSDMNENVRILVDSFLKNRKVEIWKKKNVVTIQPFTHPNGISDIYHILLDDGSVLQFDAVICCNVDYQHGNTSYLQPHFSSHLDGRGFAKVDQYLRFAGKKNIFALGDVAGLNECKIAERAKAHAILVSGNIQRIINGLELEPYRERPVPKTYDLLLGPNNGIQIDNGRFVRFGPGALERRATAERKLMHRFGSISYEALNVQWQTRSLLASTPQQSRFGSPQKLSLDDETFGSNSTDPELNQLTEKTKPLTRKASDGITTEEDSEEIRNHKPPRKRMQHSAANTGTPK